ncbi:hypothetical protein PQQ96_21710 [Paraburkholderia sediminicola]|uniref:hypothetical protein n=1 Tax=Paraburkholderia sediminicola TaxID=458836 RepID=UPI0038B7D580
MSKDHGDNVHPVVLASSAMAPGRSVQDVLRAEAREKGMTQAAANAAVLNSPDSVASAFIAFGGVLGGILKVVAQSKEQVLNTYSSSPSLTSLSDSTINWRPGRITFVVLASVVSAMFLSGSILSWFNAFITVLGVLMICYAGIILADYFIVARRHPAAATPSVNWLGVASAVISFVLAHYVLNTLIPIEFFTSLIGALVLYPLLSRLVPRRLSLQTQ